MSRTKAKELIQFLSDKTDFFKPLKKKVKVIKGIMSDEDVRIAELQLLEIKNSK